MPIRDGLTLIVLGRNGSASMSGDAVDRRVPGDPVAVRAQRLVGARVGQVGVLEPGVRERLGDARGRRSGTVSTSTGVPL